MENIIEIENLKKSYGKFNLEIEKLDIPKGSIVGVVGQNGAGKTTMIKSMLEIIKRDGGKVKLLGTEDVAEAKKDMGVILDGAFFPELLKIKDIAKILKQMYEKWDDDLFDKYLTEFKLEKKSQIKELSTGMRKKLEIAASLAHHPKLLILDEPTSGLDPIVRSEILDIFLEFVEDENNSIMLSSHITSDLENVADYIVFINDGKVVLNKSIDELKEKYAIVKCKDTDIEKIDSSCVIGHIKNKYDCEVLVSDKEKVKKENKDLVIENATIEAIMLIIVKGVK